MEFHVAGTSRYAADVVSPFLSSRPAGLVISDQNVSIALRANLAWIDCTGEATFSRQQNLSRHRTILSRQRSVFISVGLEFSWSVFHHKGKGRL